jgi:hypothetical protein
MLPLSLLEYSITERQIELRKLLEYQHILQGQGNIRKQGSPLRFVRTALSVVRLPLEVLRSVHAPQREPVVSSKKRSAGVCETRLS